MFKKDTSNTANTANIDSFISPGVEIIGDIVSQTSIRIDGKVSGTIEVKGDLILGEKGIIKGQINVENFTLAGVVEGNANIKGRFAITSSGVMKGDITSSILTIEEGGVLEGTSQRYKDNKNTKNEEPHIKADKGGE